MYNLILQRDCANKSCIRGALVLDDGKRAFRICETLEPSPNCLLFPNCDGSKCYPAIEEGIYSLSITYSPKFRKSLPLIDVPKRQGIRIHAGNNSFDTTGCVLVGVVGDSFSISHSRISLDYVVNVIKALRISSIQVSNAPNMF